MYNLFIYAYRLGIGVAALWNKKAKLWISGRENLIKNLKAELAGCENVVWIHCSSAGEFEQGKPILERIKNDFPLYTILVTFFSPSGLQAAKNYKRADVITYLPLDTANNAANFLSVVQPKLVIFVKYDYWYHHLNAIAKRNIPLILISAIFRENSIFFKPYGSLHRKMLSFFSWVFVQDKLSKDLLSKIEINHCSVAGDTRFDRVKTIANNFTSLPVIEKFIANKMVVVAGSTWYEDELLLSEIKTSENLKLIVAPHEINKAHLEKLFNLFPQAVAHSQIENVADLCSIQVLIIDNIGMLSRLYHYATVAYIGGGFNKSGIHNTLEAAVWGKPILFGPNFQKFKEAKDLINEGAAFSITTKEELCSRVNQFLIDPSEREKSGQASEKYVAAQTGATHKIMQYIQENRLLTKL